MLFEDMKKFYMTIGFLDEFNNRGFSVSYPGDDYYVSNHLNYLIELASKYNIGYRFSEDMYDDEKVELLEMLIDSFFESKNI